MKINNDSSRFKPQAIHQLLQLDVPEGKRWQSVTLEKLKGFQEYDTISEMLERLGYEGDKDAVEPFLLKCKDGCVERVYTPRIGVTEDDGELVLQIGNEMLPITEEFFKTELIVTPTDRPQVYFHYNFNPDDEDDVNVLKLGYYMETPLSPAEFTRIGRYQFFKGKAPIIRKKSKESNYRNTLSPIEHQGSEFEIIRLVKIHCTSKDGKAFDLYKAVVKLLSDNGSESQAEVILKNTAKRVASNTLANKDTHEYTGDESAVLRLGEAQVKKYKDTEYTDVQMRIVKPLSPMLSNIFDI